MQRAPPYTGTCECQLASAFGAWCPRVTEALSACYPAGWQVLISFSARTAPTHRCANAGCAFRPTMDWRSSWTPSTNSLFTVRNAAHLPTGKELSTTPRSVSCASSADYAWLPVIAWRTPCLQAIDGRARQQPVRVMRPEMASPRGGSFHGLATGLAAYSSDKVLRACDAHGRTRTAYAT